MTKNKLRKICNLPEKIQPKLRAHSTKNKVAHGCLITRITADLRLWAKSKFYS